MGLYSTVPLKRGQRLGRIDGRVVHTFACRADALAHARTVSSDRLVTLCRGYGVQLMVMHGTFAYINDVRGTRLRPNVRITSGGYVEVVAHRILANDELRCDYGPDYWDE